MKRTPLKRKTPLRSNSKGPRKRVTAVKKVNAKRHRKKFGKQAEYVRKLPCCVCGSEWDVVAHHEPKRSLGGKDEDTLPMCVVHHHVRHGPLFDVKPAEFWAHYGVNSDEVKAEIHEAMQRRAA